MTISEFLAEELQDTREWTRKLIADLHGDDWVFQPAPGLAHPLWICGHLAVSQHTLVFVRCLKQNILVESFSRHFPIGGPIASAKDYGYPNIANILDTMEDMHEQTVAAVHGMSDALLSEPAFAADGKSPHPHYKDKRGAVAHCNRHEAFHAGQLAMIRRLLGKQFLR